MNDLAAFFDDIAAAVAEKPAAALPTFPTEGSACGKTQTFDAQDISHVSHISHPENTDRGSDGNLSVRARVGAGERARARDVFGGVGNVGSVGNARRINDFPFPQRISDVGNVGNRGAPTSPADPASFDERAGFLEHDCGLTRESAEAQAAAEFGIVPPLPSTDGLALWRAGVARLDYRLPPCPGYRGEEWSRVLDKLVAFLDDFGSQAEALGWTATRLFGVDPVLGIQRVDRCGALVLTLGGPVRAITETEIVLGHLTHREKPGQPEGIPLWSFKT